MLFIYGFDIGHIFQNYYPLYNFTTLVKRLSRKKKNKRKDKTKYEDSNVNIFQ